MLMLDFQKPRSNYSPFSESPKGNSFGRIPLQVIAAQNVRWDHGRKKWIMPPLLPFFSILPKSPLSRYSLALVSFSSSFPPRSPPSPPASYLKETNFTPGTPNPLPPFRKGAKARTGCHAVEKGGWLLPLGYCLHFLYSYFCQQRNT